MLEEQTGADGGLASIATRPHSDGTRRIINRVDSPDLPFHWTVNPYRGCEHGCVYCYARPTHENLGFSCGLDFETQIVVKHEAPRLLRAELAATRWSGETIVMCGVTDAYQPIDARLGLTRSCLEVAADFRQPVSIVTKSRLVLRDLDLLADLAGDEAAQVSISLTTLDAGLAGLMEPRASAPRDRLRAMSDLAAAGVPVTAMIAPVIPGLTDHEIPALLEAAADAGASAAVYVLLRLPFQVEAIFERWLRDRLPDRADRVMAATRRCGTKRQPFGARFRGSGPHAAQIDQLFRIYRRRNRLDSSLPPLSSEAFMRTRLGPTLFDRPPPGR